MKEKELDSEVDINSLLVSYLSQEAEKSFQIHLSSLLDWCEGNSLTWRDERSHQLRMLSNHSLLYRAASREILSISTNVFNFTCIYPKCINSCSVHLMSILFASIPTPTLERKTTKKTFLQLSALFSPKIAESRECGRIESVLADWIVFCSISGYIKRQKLWTYKKSDGCLLLMSEPACSWPQQKTGKAKKKERHGDLLTRPVKVEGRMNATRLSLTVRDVKGELWLLLLHLFFHRDLQKEYADWQNCGG